MNQLIKFRCAAGRELLIVTLTSALVAGFVQRVAAQGWTPTLAPSESWTAVASSADGSNLVAVANNEPGAIFISPDSGVTWTNANAPVQAWTAVATSADGTQIVAAGNNYPGAIFVSTNSGAIWTDTQAPMAEWSPPKTPPA